LDINLLKTAIASGETHKVQNNDKPNTLNIAIRRILSIKHQQELSNNVLQFNLQFIKDLMDYGAKPWNRGDKESNTLTITLKRSTTYIRSVALTSRTAAEKNVLDLLTLLVERGSKPLNTQDYFSNTLSIAIETKNPEIVKIIATTSTNSMLVLDARNWYSDLRINFNSLRRLPQIASTQ